MQVSKRNILARAAMLLFIAVFGTSGLWAEDVTAEQAREEAMSFLTHRSTSPNGLRRAPGVKPQLTLQGKVSGLYVFNVNANDGYVIVSNDDRTLPVLGFSDTGSFDPDRMPENMKAWLQGYADEIAWLQQHGSKASGPKKARGKVGSHSTDPVAPLLSTTWDQGEPYNDLCPIVDDPKYGSIKCATGCVATAMAQVMKYHEWPYDETQSIPSYTSRQYDTYMPTLPAITFNWANMKDDYSGSYNQDEATAVATLMQYCGCSVQMSYGPSSGSNTNMVAYALKAYFDYNSTVQFITRSAYTYANWTDLIYHEIANARPVVYGGDSSTSGGHEFVCDGYVFADETDYFHINWGWGGLSDNYFVLSVLNPDEQGIGGNDSGEGFRHNQDAVIGIQRSIDDGTIADVPTRNISLYANSITVCTPIAVVGQPVRAIINVHNYSEDEYDADIGIARMGEGEGFNVEYLNTAEVYIPAGETKDCVIEFVPTKAGTYNLISFFPSSEHETIFDGEIKATVDVLEEWNQTTNSVVPVYGIWCDQYSQSQFIIAEAYMQGMQDVFIKGMTFYAEQEDVSWGAAEFDVYLSEVSETTISELMDWNTLEKVYAGKLSISGNKMDISFDKAFHYHGGNLLIGINQTVQGSFIDCNWYGISAYEASYGGFWNDTEYTSQQNFLPIVSFDLMSASDSQKPTDLAVSDITSSSAVISWDGSAESYNLRYTTYTPGTVVFTEDFENGLDAQGWTVVRNGEGNYWTDWQKESATGFVGHKNHGGKWGAMARDYNGNETVNVDNWLITPQLALGGTLTCWMYDMYFSAQCDIYVCTAAFDPYNFDESVFTKVYEPVNAYAEWTEQTVDLSAYTGEMGYIAFRHKGDVLFIDDVTITGPIDLSDTWTDVPNVTSPYTLGGLAEDTSYMVEVQAVQGNVASEWVGITFTIPSSNPVPYNITADLAADGATLTWEGTGDFYIVRYRTVGDTEAVFFDDFENGLDQWTVYTEGESSRPNGWNSQTSSNIATAYSGDHFAGAWSTNCNADNWLVTPQLTLGKELRFWVCVNKYNPDSYEVRLSTTGNAITDFTEELQALAPAPDNGGWNEVVIDLSAYAGQTGYIAIRHACYDNNFLFVDDFGVYDYTIRTGDWEQMTAYDKTATLSGFATNTGYEYQIQSIRESSESQWSAIQDFALLTLANDEDNTSLINAFNGKKAHVTLAGRTFYKDGNWNTIFLPFDIKYDDLASTPLAGADFRSLTGNDYDGENTILKFSINLTLWYDDFEGNYPHIIKWESGSDIVNPEFANVTITSETDYTQIYNHTSGIRVTFKGTYDPITFANENKSILFVGAGNKLYWPLPGASIGAMRCYFEITGLTAGIKECIMDFGESDPDGISEISDNNESHDWYDLSGRKLAGKPTMKGIYVNNGRKVTIK